MRDSDDQDLLNVLKYNQDRLDNLTKKAENSINKLEEILSSPKMDEYDFSSADTGISNSLKVIEKYGFEKPTFEKEEYHPIEYEQIELDHVCQQSWEELVDQAKDEGYIDISIEDILTPEEIADADKRYAEIENSFAEKVKLNKRDIVFLVTAIALQCVRQYVLTPFEERVTADEASKKIPRKNDEKSKEDIKRYYVPTSKIISDTKVPYDVISGSKKFNLGGQGKGLSGKTHRFRTLGHDPILGYLFGTSNILTNTLTDWRGKSYHIKYLPDSSGRKVPTIAQNANTEIMFDKVKKRFKTDKKAVVAAIVKQHWHIKSDISKAGLPIPFLSAISPELVEDLADNGLDAIFLKEVGEQIGWSAFINFLISTIHTLMYDEKKDGSRELYEVRTRKILLYSNLIASVSNIIVVGIGVALGSKSGNAENIKKSLKYLDVGGLIVTIGRLFTDVRFITKIKDEFINMELCKDIEKEISEIDGVLEELNNIKELNVFIWLEHVVIVRQR